MHSEINKIRSTAKIHGWNESKYWLQFMHGSLADAQLTIFTEKSA